MNNILEECEKMAKFITSSQEYNPSPHIDDKTMLNIRTELTDYRYVWYAWCGGGCWDSAGSVPGDVCIVTDLVQLLCHVLIVCH